MSFILGVVIGFVAGLCANLVTPGVGHYFTVLRDRLFLNKIYYDININIRSIVDVVKLTSDTVDIKYSGLTDDTYILNFILSCRESKGMADFLRKKGFTINFTLHGVDNVNFYPLNIQTRDVDFDNPTNFIEFGPDELEYPKDRAFSALISSSSNEGIFTISFSYSLYKEHTEIKNIRFRNKVTIFDSIQVDKINCQKIPKLQNDE